MGRGRAPCCAKVGLNRGSWTPEEDVRLISYIHKYGHGNWRALPKLAGLLRCGKSCRLRWINYLRPDIKRGNFTKEEEDAIIKLHGLLGNKWSKIASCLPGRTDNEIKNVWNTHLKKRLAAPKEQKPQEKPDQEQQPSSPSSISTASASCSYEGESKAAEQEQTEANIEATSCNGKEETNMMMMQDPSLSTEAAALLVDLPEIDPMGPELWSMLIDDDMDKPTSPTGHAKRGTGDESEKWLAYLEKELDLWGENTTSTATVTADVMEGGDPVASYFQALQFSTSPLDLL